MTPHKPISSRQTTAVLAAVLALAGFRSSAATEAGEPVVGEAKFDQAGKLIPPSDYREWVFLSSGVDMSYTENPAMAGAHMFDNVFAPRAAYAVFQKTGAWPDKTVLILENRGGASKGSINKLGQFQTGEVMGVEAHVKDLARFKGGWGFFALDGATPATQIPYAAACYACHQSHAAADTTFVQFYPTLLPIAAKLGALSPSYLAETKLAAGK